MNGRFSEEDLLPLSGLQHLLFCERQCALIHVEGYWLENRLTAEGRRLHERADSAEAERRGSVGIARSLPLRSFELGLIGFADVVEFHETGDGAVPFPVEYKRGARRRWLHDEVQLCAQGMALEEMLGTAVPAGAVFYGRSRRRRDVSLDPPLRQRTREAAAQFHEIVAARRTPLAKRQPKCRSCSLLEVCQPAATTELDPAGYLRSILEGIP